MELSGVLLRSGKVSQADVDRVGLEMEIHQHFKNIVKTIRDEITAWIKTTGKLIPTEVLEAWALLDERKQQVEWSKWLAAYREAN